MRYCICWRWRVPREWSLLLMIFQAVSDRIPLLADLKPSGRYSMLDLHERGGTPAVIKFLLAEGLLEGDCLTVTGRTLAENVAELPGLDDGQRYNSSIKRPHKSRRAHSDFKRKFGTRRCSSKKLPVRKANALLGPARVF